MARTANRNWKFLLNPFKWPLIKSQIKTAKFAIDHHSRLKKYIQNPDFDEATKERLQEMYNRTNEVFEKFLATRSELAVDKRNYHIAVRNTETELDKLKKDDGQIVQWQDKIVGFRPSYSADYKEGLFPNGRQGFTTGTIDERINALRILAETYQSFEIKDNAEKAILADIEAFYKNVFDLRAIQTGKNADLAEARSKMEGIHTKLVLEFFRNLVRLLDIFLEETERVVNFFDLTLIRSRSATGEDKEIPTELIEEPVNKDEEEGADAFFDGLK